MARYYSDHFNSSGVAPSLASTTNVTLDTTFKPSVGIAHARMRKKRPHIVIGTAATIGDEIRLTRFRSSDRIYDIRVTAAGATAAAGDIGVYRSGAAHDGAVLDVDLFATAIGLTAAARADGFTEATTLANKDRGKQLWELVNIGVASTFASDPMIDMDLVITVTTSFTVALDDIVVEIDYAAGD